jgi:hypothetical protein
MFELTNKNKFVMSPATEGTEITENGREIQVRSLLGVLGERCGIKNFMLFVVFGEASEPLMCPLQTT